MPLLFRESKDLLRCHVLQGWSLIGSLDVLVVSRIHHTPSREEVITFDELQQRVININYVLSMQLLLHALTIASQSSAHGAIKAAI